MVWLPDRRRLSTFADPQQTLVPTGIQDQEITVDTLNQVTIFVPTNSSQPLQLLAYDPQLMTADTPACS